MDVMKSLEILWELNTPQVGWQPRGNAAVPRSPRGHTPGLRSDPDRASILPKSTHRANSKPCQGFPPPAPAAARRLPPP